MIFLVVLGFVYVAYVFFMALTLLSLIFLQNKKTVLRSGLDFFRLIFLYFFICRNHIYNIHLLLQQIDKFDYHLQALYTH